MGFLKAVTIVTLWILLSFFWVSMGQSAERNCLSYGDMETWLKPHLILNDWYQFYVIRHDCEPRGEAFFKTLASSEPLSTKLNQAKVTFDQFYVPISNLISINWESVKTGREQNIQSDLILIDHGIRKALSKMSSADQDYFRAIVLLDLPSEFASIPTNNQLVLR